MSDQDFPVPERDRVAEFFAACKNGDVERARELIAGDPSLVRVADAAQPNGGWTALHTAARNGRLEIVRLLLEHGADPNTREAGDNTYPLHWAAAAGYADVVRALLDAGGDVHGFGDVHELDAIGWATFFHAHDRQSASDVVPLLLERGARHHIFSALSVGDPNLIREVVKQQPGALGRRMSRFEHRQTPLHFAMSRKRYDLLDLLIELGADLEAEDGGGRTALAVAMLRGDQEAMRRLYAAGATPPSVSPSVTQDMSKLAGSVKKVVPMIMVPDVAAALDWYASIGFTEMARYGDDGVVNFGMVAFGDAQLMLNMHGKPGKHDADLWFYTDHIDELYQTLKSRQLAAARASLVGDAPVERGIEFVEDLYDPFYGGRQFSIRDLNGYGLLFYQE